jgi:hypothetical protein
MPALSACPQCLSREPARPHLASEQVRLVRGLRVRCCCCWPKPEPERDAALGLAAAPGGRRYGAKAGQPGAHQQRIADAALCARTQAPSCAPGQGLPDQSLKVAPAFLHPWVEGERRDTTQTQTKQRPVPAGPHLHCLGAAHEGHSAQSGQGRWRGGKLGHSNSAAATTASSIRGRLGGAVKAPQPHQVAREGLHTCAGRRRITSTSSGDGSAANQRQQQNHEVRGRAARPFNEAQGPVDCWGVGFVRADWAHARQCEG